MNLDTPEQFSQEGTFFEKVKVIFGIIFNEEFNGDLR